jgi:hypothetical protein
MTDRTAQSEKWRMPRVDIGLDRAMPLFQHHGSDTQGEVVITRLLGRDTALVAQNLALSRTSI